MELADFPQTRRLDIDVRVLSDVDSTNTYLALNPGSPQRTTVVVTDHQTSGRGRSDRHWVLPPGRGMAVSIQLPSAWLPDPIDASWLQWLALVVGGATADAITPHVGPRVGVKWPNDVLIEGKKVAGVLGEVTPDGHVIIGIGINLFFDEDNLPTPHATSMSLYGASPEGLADAVLSALVGHITRIVPTLRGGITPPLRDWVCSRLDTLGQEVMVTLPTGHSHRGVASGLTADGSLVVTPGGNAPDVTITVGDISHLRHHPGR
jgi:BirA family biotin operon repressor/biotin-[acetyl-CoA-carboxylase] ligase